MGSYRTLSPWMSQDIPNLRNPRLPSCCLKCTSFVWSVDLFHKNRSKSSMRPILSTLRESGDQESAKGESRRKESSSEDFGSEILCVSEPDQPSVSIPVSVPSTNIFIFSRNPEFKLSFVRFYISFPPAAQKLPPPFLFISWSIQPLWAGTLLYTPGRFS